jgi:hypothetical protein
MNTVAIDDEVCFVMLLLLKERALRAGHQMGWNETAVVAK